MEVRRIAAAETRPLRAAVLRPGEPLVALALPGEDDPRAAHFGIVVDGTIVAVASAIPHSPESFRIRAVATAPAFRGRGFGQRLIRACAEHAAQRGAAEVWLRTTLEVAPWYERQGFRRVGEPYVMERGVRQRLARDLREAPP